MLNRSSLFTGDPLLNRTPILLLIPALLLISACASKPLNPWTSDSPPQALVPVADAGINDQRGRYREEF